MSHSPQDASHQEISSFSEFYPFNLSEHKNRTSRRLHFCGTLLVLVLIATTIWLRRPLLLVLLPVVGYCFVWIGHYVFEKNRSATSKNLLDSLLGAL